MPGPANGDELEKPARVGPQHSARIARVDADPALEEDEAVGLEFLDLLDHVRGALHAIFMNPVHRVADTFQRIRRVSLGRPILFEVAEERDPQRRSVARVIARCTRCSEAVRDYVPMRSRRFGTRFGRLASGPILAA